MIPHIPDQRRTATKGKPFNDLIKYQTKGQEKQQLIGLEAQFGDILSYATAEQDKATDEEKCLATRTHRISNILTAGDEMNAVSAQNLRCKDPAYHFILSWPEHEHPEHDAMFDAAAHAIKSLGLGDHQYVIAIHGNTDNMHCHIAVNRIHPDTFESHHISRSWKKLHYAARESEIKHGWTHDNGIYVVDIDKDGKKQIKLNKDHSKAIGEFQQHTYPEKEKMLPVWTDPEGLAFWLKSDVAGSLKHKLPKLESWNDLHSWLHKRGISLTYTGVGMRISAASPDTGEILNLPTSKGLRVLKYAELEARWGKFTSRNAFKPIPHTEIESEATLDHPDHAQPCIVPDLSHLSPQQIAKGVEDVIRRSFDHGIPPDPNIIVYLESDRTAPPPERRSGLHELPAGGLATVGQVNSEMLLPNALPVDVGDIQPRQDQNLRRPGAGETGSRNERSLGRDGSKREERKQQRAVARADLRQRFATYTRFVQDADIDYRVRQKEIRAERTIALKEIRAETKAAKLAINSKPDDRLILQGVITAEAARRKLEAESAFQAKARALQGTRKPPLGWREWLHEQSNLGDQAAISALRGIVYQAQRDAKKASALDEEEKENESSDEQFRKLMTRLLEEEKKEIAIRSASMNAMRPFESDALLVRYTNMQWHVTGNGNIEYSENSGQHLFTDRGNRLTFDRSRVEDEEISMALVHAQAKFGDKLTLTGDDQIFTQRMARLADDMGIVILNPELQQTIAEHREARRQQPYVTPVPIEAFVPAATTKEPDTAKSAPEPVFDGEVQPTQSERIKAMVLSIDPRAQFEIADVEDSQRMYAGPIVAEDEQGEREMFVQRTGRGVYTLHAGAAHLEHEDRAVEIRYQNGRIVVALPSQKKEMGRDE